MNVVGLRAGAMAGMGHFWGLSKSITGAPIRHLPEGSNGPPPSLSGLSPTGPSRLES